MPVTPSDVFSRAPCWVTNDRTRLSASLEVMNIRWIDSLGLDQGRESDRSSTAGLRHSPDLSSDVSLRLRDSISTIIISICMRSIMRRNCTGRVTVRLCLYFSLRSTPAPRVLHRSKVSVEALTSVDLPQQTSSKSTLDTVSSMIHQMRS